LASHSSIPVHPGLEDSDDENESSQKTDDLPESSQQPINIPPRQMELLDLQETAIDNDNNKEPSLHIVKLPNLVGISTTSYDASNHNLEEEENYYRGYVHNMIRWRYVTDDNGEVRRDDKGELVRESNTRLVKWSDGSYTLHVGQEVLEVDTLDSSVPAVVDGDRDNKGSQLPGFAGINGYLYVSQKARIRPPKKEKDEEQKNNEDDSEDEEEAQPAGTVLECLGPIASRFAPRPSSLASEAHRNLTNAIRQRNVKRARITEIVTDFDPEKEKMARIKGKDDLVKSQQRGGRRSGGGGGRRSRMDESYLEEDDHHTSVNLGKLKRQTMRKEYDEDEEMDYGEDSESEEDEWSKNKKRKRGVAAAAARDKKKREYEESESSNEEGELVFGNDDDEDDGTMFKKRGGAKKSNVLDDDDD
jgi:RNA polymerase-associated protein LEO1